MKEGKIKKLQASGEMKLKDTCHNPHSSHSCHCLGGKANPPGAPNKILDLNAQSQMEMHQNFAPQLQSLLFFSFLLQNNLQRAPLWWRTNSSRAHLI